jgi:hypothetical protein
MRKETGSWLIISRPISSKCNDIPKAFSLKNQLPDLSQCEKREKPQLEDSTGFIPPAFSSTSFSGSKYWNESSLLSFFKVASNMRH